MGIEMEMGMMLQSQQPCSQGTPILIPQQAATINQSINQSINCPSILDPLTFHRPCILHSFLLFQQNSPCSQPLCTDSPILDGRISCARPCPCCRAPLAAADVGAVAVAVADHHHVTHRRPHHRHRYHHHHHDPARSGTLPTATHPCRRSTGRSG